jgi:uncharacterized coiled-coil DUF342 family protein
MKNQAIGLRFLSAAIAVAALYGIFAFAERYLFGFSVVPCERTKEIAEITKLVEDAEKALAAKILNAEKLNEELKVVRNQERTLSNAAVPVSQSIDVVKETLSKLQLQRESIERRLGRVEAEISAHQKVIAALTQTLSKTSN